MLAAASCAVIVAVSGEPAVDVPGALTVKWSRAPEATVARVAALVEVQERQIAVTV